MRGALAAPIALTVLLLAGCATSHALSDPPPDGVPAPSRTEAFGDADSERLVVRAGDAELWLAPLTVSLNDPIRADDYPAVGADDLYVFVRPIGWPLYAQQFTGTPYECGEREYPPEVEELGGGWWRVSPVGPATRYMLSLSAGSGPGTPPWGEMGGAAALLNVETSVDRPAPAPWAFVEFQVLDSEESTLVFDLSHLTATPGEVSASITMTGAGAPLHLDLTRYVLPCPSGGSVTFLDRVSPDVVSALGEGEWRYEVTLVMDGTTYRASAMSGDRISPVALEFSPALP